MTEEDARIWLRETFGVSRETEERLETLVALVREEAGKQNLVARSTLEAFWERHIVDSAQLLQYAPKGGESGKSGEKAETWLDLGAGAGFPGLVIAIMSDFRVYLSEMRRLRTDFLRSAVRALDLGDKCEVLAGNADRIPPVSADMISARAFAPLPRLFETGSRFSTEKTRWLLSKGVNVHKEVEEAEKRWHFLFHVKQSATHEDGAILVCEQVRARRRR